MPVIKYLLAAESQAFYHQARGQESLATLLEQLDCHGRWGNEHMSQSVLLRYFFG
jgi:hypothetical protein